MKFFVLQKNVGRPSNGKGVVYLAIDNWDDYSFLTSFYMTLHDEEGQLHDIGSIKIAFKSQPTNSHTCGNLKDNFESLGENFFSLGQSVDYYRNLASLPNNFGKKILLALQDIALQPSLIEAIKEEKVVSASLLRSVSLSVVKGQYARVLEGKAELTEFNFKFVRPEKNNFGGIDISFEVGVNSMPSTNIHAIIGRNGIGKTTLLNGMIEAITTRQNAEGKFFNINSVGIGKKISDDFFSSLVSVSFSAFDPFIPPSDQPDPAKGTCYFYIGLKDPNNGELHRKISDLRNDCAKALISCFYDSKKSERWLNAISKLGSDDNFAEMRLERLKTVYKELRDEISIKMQSDSEEFLEHYSKKIDKFLIRMSSGHAIVLLTITRLVATVEEKTLVLLDEPESHLHPPLLSAFVRALADLLHDKNGVAIIATHSPVVLQEIPRSCVWKINRVREDVQTSRPMIETFGENIGVLTSEVFTLEVIRSGFHDLLEKSVKSGDTYEAIVANYDNQLGFEGRAILKALIANRDRENSNDATA